MGFKGAVSAGLAAAAVSLTAGPAAAAPRVPVLRGHTTVTGDATSVTTVRLPKAIDPIFGMSVTFSGAGRVRGLVLTQRGESVFETPTYATVAPNRCPAAGCPDEGVRGAGFFTGVDRRELPAGEYRMFLIADGAPIRANVVIEDLSGETTIAPKEPAEADVDSFQTRRLTTPDGTVYVGGGWSEMGGQSRGFAAMLIWGDRNVVEPRPWAFGVCEYFFTRDHPAPEHAFAPGCPGSTGVPNVTVGTEGPGYVLSYFARDTLPYGLGAYSVVPQAAENEGVGLWMPLGEALPEQAP